MYELIELTECELEAVAGGNPNQVGTVVLTAAGIASTVNSAINQAFASDNHSAAAIDSAIDQHVSIS
jgi:hypothetical protein